MLLMAQAPRSAQRTSGEEAVLEDVHDYYALCCKVVSAQTNILTDIALFGFPGGSDGKASACNVGDPGLIPGSGRKWLPSPVFLPGKSHGWRNLVGYSPWGHKELDTTE